MRARWEFFFECEGILFERVHMFEATVTEQHAQAFGLAPQAFDALITIEPDKESHNPQIEQTGRLKITLPGSKDQTKRAAYWLAENATQQITFSQGRVRVVYGLITGEHLPDNPDEAKELGDKPYFAEAHLVEVKPTPSFDGSSLQSVAGSPLVQQFNDAANANSPIDRFLGLFRILEDLYGPSDRKTTLAQALQASDELFSIAQKQLHVAEGNNRKQFTRSDYLGLVENLVKTRHQCAHLRREKNFGITHGDPRARKEVEPLANMIRELAYDAIRLRS